MKKKVYFYSIAGAIILYFTANFMVLNSLSGTIEKTLSLVKNEKDTVLMLIGKKSLNENEKSLILDLLIYEKITEDKLLKEGISLKSHLRKFVLCNMLSALNENYFFYKEADQSFSDISRLVAEVKK